MTSEQVGHTVIDSVQAWLTSNAPVDSPCHHESRDPDSTLDGESKQVQLHMITRNEFHYLDDWESSQTWKKVVCAAVRSSGSTTKLCINAAGRYIWNIPLYWANWNGFKGQYIPPQHSKMGNAIQIQNPGAELFPPPLPPQSQSSGRSPAGTLNLHESKMNKTLYLTSDNESCVRHLNLTY